MQLYGKQANPNTVREFLANQQAAIARTPTGFALDTLPILRYFPLQKTNQGVLVVQKKMENIYNEEIQDARVKIILQLVEKLKGTAHGQPMKEKKGVV